MGLHSEITSAIAKHRLWKTNLKTAINAGSSEFSIATVKRDDQCVFGKWLLSVADVRVKKSEHYIKCKDLHLRFHEATAKVLALALAGKKGEAEQAMGPTGDFSNLSAKLTMAMMEWVKATPE